MQFSFSPKTVQQLKENAPRVHDIICNSTMHDANAIRPLLRWCGNMENLIF